MDIILIVCATLAIIGFIIWAVQRGRRSDQRSNNPAQSNSTNARPSTKQQSDDVIRKLSFVVVVFDWSVKSWLDENIRSEQEGLQFAIEAVRDIGGTELFEHFEDLTRREGASALTMMGMKDWDSSRILENIDKAFGNNPSIQSSRISLIREGKGPQGGTMAIVFFVAE